MKNSTLFGWTTTANKSFKGSGGIIGLTLKGPALARWFLARSVTAACSSNFQKMLAHKKKPNNDEDKGTDTNKAEIKRWNTHVEKMTYLFEGTFIDLFNLDEPPPHLVNFATGMVAMTAVEGSLTGALQKGAEMASKFVKERLVKEGNETTSSSKSYYDPIQKSNVKSMVEMNKSVKIRARNISLSGEATYL